MAGQKFRDDRGREFAKAAREAEAVWFPDATIGETSCLRLAASVRSGELDLDKHGEFFPTLQEIKTEMDKWDQAEQPRLGVGR